MLRAIGLSKSYDEKEAVRGVDLELVPGRIVGLVGNNGAGKTTTIKILVGLLAPSSGSVLIEGASPTKPDTRRKLGYLPEESPLYDDLNALDYLAFFGTLYDLPRAEARGRAQELLGRLRLDAQHWKRPIGTLSKGMRRKIAIARAVLHDPPVLVFDEPTSGLDPGTARELDDFLKALRAEGKAILLSAHNLPQVEELCDEILVMHDARIVARGSLSELRSSFGTVRYRIKATTPFAGGAPDGPLFVGTVARLDDVEATLREVKAKNGVVLEVESVWPSLEEIMRRASGAHA